MGSHHPLWPPSSAHRWATCTASPKLIENLELEEGPASWYAAEGTLAHEVLAHVLSAALKTEPYDVGSEHERDGHTVTVTQEMYTHAHACSEYIDDLVGEVDEGNRFVESRVKIPFQHGLATEGSVDFFGWPVHTKETHLHVLDYKYGKGVPVPVAGNKQLVLYALGVLYEYSSILPSPPERVTLHIYQPRLSSFEPQQWSVSIQALTTYAEEFSEAARASVQGEGVFRPSEDACRWCPIAGKCSARAEYMEERMLSEFLDLSGPGDIVVPAVEFLDGSDCARVLEMMPDVRAWFDAVAAEATKRLELDPHAIPGYKLVHGRSQRSWRDPARVERVLKESRAGDTMWVRKLVSPAQAEAALSAGRLEKVRQYIAKRPGKPTVVTTDDPRPAIDAGFEDLTDN